MYKSLMILLVVIFANNAVAAMWSITYPRPMDEQDLRAEYPLALLTLALEKTGVKYTLRPSDRIMFQGKFIRQLRENREVNVIWTMTDNQREKDLLPIRIPIAKGLIGWRVYMIKASRQKEFNGINDQQDMLKKLPISGEEWPDTKIMQANGYNVFTVRDYPNAFEVLAGERADFFPRSVIEVLSEMEDDRMLPSVALEKKLVMYYPSAMYFFVNKGNPTLARLIETGLKRAIEDGSFDALFMSTYEEALQTLNLSNRKIIALDNPLLSDKTPIQDEKLWYRPQIQKKQ